MVASRVSDKLPAHYIHEGVSKGDIQQAVLSGMYKQRGYHSMTKTMLFDELLGPETESTRGSCYQKVSSKRE